MVILFFEAGETKYIFNYFLLLRIPRILALLTASNRLIGNHPNVVDIIDPTPSAPKWGGGGNEIHIKE